MEITKIELSFPRKQGFKFKGWAKITIDDSLTIAGIKFFENTQNPENIVRYIIFPEQQPALEHTNGQNVSIPLVTASDELKTKITEAIFEEYKKKPQRQIKKFSSKESHQESEE